MAAACELEKNKKQNPPEIAQSSRDKRPRWEEEEAANGETNKAGRKMQRDHKNWNKPSEHQNKRFARDGRISKCLTVAPS